MYSNIDTITHSSKESSYHYDDTKEVKIDGCNYKLSADQLKLWLEMYGTVDSHFEEEARGVDVGKDIQGSWKILNRDEAQQVNPQHCSNVWIQD